MIRGRCPICGASYEIESLDQLPSFPFCSPRCRLVDLGRWFDGAYTIPAGSPTPDDGSEQSSDQRDEESADD
jgi:endogenous inhibitor of DNA gyrase (YacG/DUF329 family)